MWQHRLKLPILSALSHSFLSCSLVYSLCPPIASSFSHLSFFIIPPLKDSTFILTLCFSFTPLTLSFNALFLFVRGKGEKRYVA